MKTSIYKNFKGNCYKQIGIAKQYNYSNDCISTLFLIVSVGKFVF